MSLATLSLEILDSICGFLNTQQYFERERSDICDNDFFTHESESASDHDASDILESHQNTSNDAYRSRQVNSQKFSRCDLVNLSLVSWQLNRVVEAHLYAVHNQHQDRNVPFLYQIIKKPYRTSFVRCLRIEPKGKKHEWQPFPGCTLELVSRLLSDILHRATVVSGECSWSFCVPYDIEKISTQQEIVAQWLILHLPQCETIKISLPYEWKFQLLHYIAKYDKEFCYRLRRLHILGPPTWQTDCMFPTSPDTLNIDAVRVLLGVEYLEEICFDYCATSDADDKPRLTAPEINHWSCVSDACQIKDILATCSNLHYHELDYDNNVALDLSYLSKSCSSLQRLELHVDRLSANSLQAFSQLREVIISACSFDRRRPGTRWGPDEEQKAAWEAPVSGLATILPTCLVVLQLSSITRAEAKRVWQDRLYFMIARATRKFSHLKAVHIAWDPSDDLRHACSLADIQLRVYESINEVAED